MQFRVAQQDKTSDAITVVVRRIDGRPSALIEFPPDVQLAWANGWLTIPTAVECAEVERKKHRLSSIVVNIRDRELWPGELGELVED